jgi:toxin ParE1/3/4
MKGQLKLSPLAQYDLSEIWDYTAAQWNSDQAETYIRRLAQTMALIAAEPQLGQPCPHIREGYRRFPCGAHIMFYRLMDPDVEIVRILHKSMDFNRRLD